MDQTFLELLLLFKHIISTTKIATYIMLKSFALSLWSSITFTFRLIFWREGESFIYLLHVNILLLDVGFVIFCWNWAKAGLRPAKPRLDRRARIQFWGFFNVLLCACGAQLGWISGEDKTLQKEKRTFHIRIGEDEMLQTDRRNPWKIGGEDHYQLW